MKEKVEVKDDFPSVFYLCIKKKNPSLHAAKHILRTLSHGYRKYPGSFSLSTKVHLSTLPAINQILAEKIKHPR